MELKFRCPECNRKLEVDASLSGTRVACPNCQSDVTIPELKIGPGVTIGGCRIERPIGKGAMGEVFLATQLSMARNVALKILPSALTSNREFVGRFLHEVRMAAKLEHANIVSAFDAGEDNGVYYFAMAYVDGTGLDIRLKKHGALPEKEALGIALKVAQALSYAWTRFHLLHRDVKPANILVDVEGEPMLTDMGIAKTMGDDRGSNLTATGVAVGTPHYMSPEQARGQSDLDLRADMYSLGATLYHLVVGEVPFPGTSSMEVVAKHLHDPLPPARKRNPDVSQACSDLIETMMAKDRAHRYQTWDACIRDMQAVHRGRASSAAMARAARIASEQLARHHRGDPGAGSRRPPVLLLAASAVLLLAVVVLSILLLNHRGTRVVHVTESAALPPAAAVPAAPPSETGNRTSEPTHDPEPAENSGHPAGRSPEAEPTGDQVTAPQPENTAPIQSPETEPSVPAAGPSTQTATTEPLPQPETETAATTAPEANEPENPAVPDGDGQTTPPALQRLEAELAPVADDLLQRRYGKALVTWQNVKDGYKEDVNDDSLQPVRDVDQLVRDVCRLPQQILDSFRADTGKTVEVQLKDGQQRLLVKGVDETEIRAMVVLEHGAMGRTFTMDDLHMREKIHRVGTSETVAGAVMWGLLAYESGRSDVAVKFFRKFDTPLGGALVREIDRTAAEGREQAAERELDAMLRVIARTLSTEDDKLIEAIRGKCDSPKRMEKARELLARFSERYADTRAGRRWVPVIETALTFPVPGQDWAIPVDALEFRWIDALNMWVGRHEVTNAQFRAYDPDHSSREMYGYTLDGDEQPVVLITFGDAVRYARWLTEREQAAGRLPAGWVYRLPSGQEWETFAACGDGRRFPWGPAWPPPDTWNYNGSEAPGQRRDQIPDFRDSFPVSCPVRDSGENEWGLFGVGGNAAEWTTGNDREQAQLRGGSWGGAGTWGRPGERYAISRFAAVNNAEHRTPHDGVRIVLAPIARENREKDQDDPR